MSSRQRAGFVWAWCVVLLPFVIPLAVLPRFGDLPRHDYWGAFAQVVDGDRLTANPTRWLDAHINEHRVAAPLALWAVNAYATAGDDRVLSTVAFALLFATAVILVRRLPASARSSPWRLAGAGFLVCAWLASPVAARVWVVGFLGTTWFLANFAAVLAIAIFCELAGDMPPDRRPAPSPLQLASLAAAGVLGVFSLASSLAVWPALVATALWVRARRALVLAVAAIGAILWAVFLIGYQTPKNHAPPNLAPNEWLPYLFSILGLPFSDDVGTARIWGAAGLALVVGGGIVASRRAAPERLALAPGVAVLAFATLNCLEIAVARSGFSDRSALAGRYAPIALLFWAGATWLLAALWFERQPALRVRARFGVGLVAGLVLGLLPLSVAASVGRVRLREELALVDLQPLAGLALSWQVPDRVALGAVIGGPAQVQGSRAFFERIGHRPFGSLATWRLGESVPVPAEGDSREEGGGKLSEFAELSTEFAAISGPVAEGAGDVRRVLVIDRVGLLVGGGLELPRATDLELHAGDHGTRRLRMLRAGSAKTERRWRGYLSRKCQPPLRVLAETRDPVGWRTIRLASPRINERVRDWCRPRANEPTSAAPASGEAR